MMFLLIIFKYPYNERTRTAAECYSWWDYEGFQYPYNERTQTDAGECLTPDTVEVSIPI